MTPEGGQKNANGRGTEYSPEEKKIHAAGGRKRQAERGEGRGRPAGKKGNAAGSRSTAPKEKNVRIRKAGRRA